MSLIECLEKVVKSESLISAAARNGTRIIELAEDNVMQVSITPIPGHIRILAIRMGGGRGSASHLGCIKDGRACRKICDYLLVVQLEATCHIAFIELKSSLAGEKKALEQLVRSLPIWDYLRSICKIECGITFKPSIKYFLIAKKGNEKLDKQSTKAVRSLGRQKQYKGITVDIVTGTEVAMSRLIPSTTKKAMKTQS